MCPASAGRPSHANLALVCLQLTSPLIGINFQLEYNDQLLAVQHDNQVDSIDFSPDLNIV